ncbi:hypothetical protein [Fusibacter bizertensis]
MDMSEKTAGIGKKVKSFLIALAFFLGKLILKIGILVGVGTLLSFAINYIMVDKLGEIMCFIGAIYALIGVGLQFGEMRVRNDYSYNMARMSSTKIFEKDYKSFFTGGNVYFLVWMTTSGIILFLIGDAVIRA